MIGVIYLLLAIVCWTVWAVLSARLGGRFSPVNYLLWTGLISAVLTGGGFLFHFRHLRMPSTEDWWLMLIFCAANTIACFGYYGALKYLPGIVVLPVSHLYLVIGPLLIALMERRSLTWQQFGALCLVMAGIVLFLAVAPNSNKGEAKAEQEGFSGLSPQREAQPALSERFGIQRCANRSCRNYFWDSAFSTACITSGESGVVRGSNRCRILPSRPMRNLPKFHLMSPGKGDFSPAKAV